MTPRERLADWITGGALTEAREYKAHYRRLAFRAEAALIAIYRATRNVKSGTGRKIHRMAKEALDA